MNSFKTLVMAHSIPLAQAIQMTQQFRTLRETILKPEFSKLDVLPLSETFDREAFDRILSLRGCKKLRIYYGMDPQSKVHAIIVGVNEADEDMVSTSTASTTTSSGLTTDSIDPTEDGIRCPPQCPRPSPLNE